MARRFPKSTFFFICLKLYRKWNIKFTNYFIDIHQASGSLKSLPYKLNLEGSKGCPLKGDPSASQAFFNASNCFSSYEVGKPFCFRCCSYIIFLIAPCVSPSKSCKGLVLFTFVVSISGSPLNTVLHILSWAFYKFKVINPFPLFRSIFQTDSPALIFS